MRKMRRIAKTLICFDVLANLSWEAGICVVGMIGIGFSMLSGDYSKALDYSGRTFIAIAILGFVLWVSRDARKQSARLRRERKNRVDNATTRTDDNISDVAGLPNNPPWMG